MKLLQQLWELDEREAQKKGKPSNHTFAHIGLWLNRPLSTWNDNCTPINSLTFAYTGGEGVHFGLLQLNGKMSDELPVCMTLPDDCGEKYENIILGSNLYEFLCLGCETGYFYLENIASGWDGETFEFYEPKMWIDEETAEYNAASMEYQQKLTLLVTEFNLKPWVNPVARLTELQEQYLPLLQLKEDE